MSAEPELPPNGWVKSAIEEFLRDTRAIAEVELKKLFRDPTELFSRAVQPVLWLVIFGQVFARARGIPTGNVPYLAFMTPGILGQSVLFSAIFYGIAVIWERDLGVVHKLLVSPATRERFMGVRQVLTMPQFFASNAIYPLELMPDWLKAIARVNPLTYLVDVLRGLMIEGGQCAHSALVDFGVMGLVFLLLLVIASRLYPTLVQ